MRFKKLVEKLTVAALAGAMTLSVSGAVWANNCKDEYVPMSFDEASGDYLNYTRSREKQDYSCGYIKGLTSSNGSSFNAALVGSDDENSSNHYEDFDLIHYNVEPSDEIWMYNYVKENGYDWAAMKCESNTGSAYTVEFLWSPDSV